jgi:hypothetical protein
MTGKTCSGGDTPQAPYPCIDQSRPKVSDTYWSSYRKADDFLHITRWQLSAYTKSMTFCSPFYCIKPSKHSVFSVCPACYHLYPVSCVTFLSLIIFKIIPHPMTLLIAFPLQVTVSYFILHRLLLLTYHHITYLLPSSHIPSPRVHLTHCLNPLL